MTPHADGPADLGSPAWRDRLAARLAGLPPVGGRRVAVGQVVTGPGGDRAWTVVAGGDRPAAVREGVDEADVCLVADEDAAALLVTGTPAAALLAEGRIKVRGDANALVEGHEALASLGTALRDSGVGEDGA